MKALMFILSSLVMGSMAYAWNEPTGFRDIPWGAPERMLREKLPVEVCRDTKDAVMPERVCENDLVPIRSGYAKGQFWFRKGGLVQVSLEFDSKYATAVEAEITEGYGPPTATIEIPPELRRYSEDTRTLIWLGLKARVKLEAQPNRIGFGRATLVTGQEREAQLRHAEKAKEDAAAAARAHAVLQRARCAEGCHQARGSDEEVRLLQAGERWNNFMRGQRRWKSQIGSRILQDLGRGGSSDEINATISVEASSWSELLGQEMKEFSLTQETYRYNTGANDIRVLYLLKAHGVGW